MKAGFSGWPFRLILNNHSLTDLVFRLGSKGSFNKYVDGSEYRYDIVVVIHCYVWACSGWTLPVLIASHQPGTAAMCAPNLDSESDLEVSPCSPPCLDW